jgi:hypothetical protein
MEFFRAAKLIKSGGGFKSCALPPDKKMPLTARWFFHFDFRNA